jgi:hypothetical protein
MSYLSRLRFDREKEDLAIILQTVDYLNDGIIISKDVYYKMTKDHLQKQLKYKFNQYNIHKELF